MKSSEIAYKIKKYINLFLLMYYIAMNRSEIAHKIKKYEFKLNNANTYDQFKYYNNKLKTYKKFIGGGGFKHLPYDTVVTAMQFEFKTAKEFTIRKLIEIKQCMPFNIRQRFTFGDADYFFPGLNAVFQKILPRYSVPITIDSFLEGIKDAINMYLCIKKERDNTRMTPSNWCGIDTPLENFTPLPQWEYLRFNDQYKLVEILNNFKTKASVYNTSGIRFSKLTQIGDRFLSNCQGLTNINLSGLTAVTYIGDNFLRDCSRLTSVNLSGLTAVTHIGNSFLLHCYGLPNVDLSGLAAVTQIGDNFLLGCDILNNVDLSCLTAVTHIGNYFLTFCENLTSVNLSGLTAVTHIDNYFLSDCPNLNNVDLSGLTAVTQIGGRFLSNCQGLTNINLSGLTAVTQIGDGFLSSCYGMTNVDLSGLASVTHIGDYFLSNCNLEKIIGMPNVTSVGRYFLVNCKSLLTITGFSQLRSAGRGFLSECPSLKEIPDSFYVLMSKK